MRVNESNKIHLETPDFTDDLKIGHKEIDRQHKIFLELIKKLEFCLKLNNEKLNASDVVEEIIYFTKYHRKVKKII